MAIYNFPYLKDFDFLKEFDKQRVKEQFAKITVLTFDETPIQEIQGRVTGGSLSLDGSSAMRRTGNLSLIADEYENDLTTTKSLLSINKKIELLIGFKNTTDKYTDFDILWFPQGIFVIMAPSISHGSNGISISLTLHDKMALLNGECGGIFPASVVFSQIESTDKDDGSLVITQPTMFQIIQQLVHHFGGQQLGKILISGVDDRIKKVMRWTGSTPLYVGSTIKQGALSYTMTTNYNDFSEWSAADREKIKIYYYGDDVGYIYTDFIYPGDLIANAGDTIVNVLDQIKKVLGNYEYFYDVNGNFRFQQVKNYLNTSYASVKLNEMNLTNYLADYTSGKSVYTFEDADLIISYSNSPQFQQIKNDFMVWGKRTTIDGKEIPIRYHLAIDKKPKVGNQYKVFFYTDPDDGIQKAERPIYFQTFNELKNIKGDPHMFYYAADTDKVYKWDIEAKSFAETAYLITTVTTKDYRQELYYEGINANPYGLDSNYYYTELKNEWPKLYNLKQGEFKEQVLQQPSGIDFFLDFIDTTDAIAEFSVENIGRRTTTLVDDSINCLFEPEIPNLVIIPINEDYTHDLSQECQRQNQDYVQVTQELYAMLANGGTLRSAYEEIRKELYQYTNYNEQVNLTALPIYYLEPNVRITIRDNASGIWGDYMIKSISLPLDTTGTMSLSCTKAFERI